MVLRKRKIAGVLCFLIAFLMFPIFGLFGEITKDVAHAILMFAVLGFIFGAIARNQPKPVKIKA